MAVYAVDGGGRRASPTARARRKTLLFTAELCGVAPSSSSLGPRASKLRKSSRDTPTSLETTSPGRHQHSGRTATSFAHNGFQSILRCQFSGRPVHILDRGSSHRGPCDYRVWTGRQTYSPRKTQDTAFYGGSVRRRTVAISRSASGSIALGCREAVRLRLGAAGGSPSSPDAACASIKVQMYVAQT